MMRKRCKFEGCTSGSRAGGLCAKHNPKYAEVKCSFLDCGRQAARQGLCDSHYKMKRKGLDLTPIHSQENREGCCEEPGCSAEIYAKRLCVNHYNKKRADEAMSQEAKDNRAKRLDFQESRAHMTPAEKSADYYQRSLQKIRNRFVARRDEPGRREGVAQRARERRKEDPAYRAMANMRSRFGNILRAVRQGKNVSVSKGIGCTSEFLIEHIEKQFLPGMSWENYGNQKDFWSLDHIKPFCLFDLRKMEDQAEAIHYSNLRPLWHVDNVRKGDQYPYTLPADHTVEPWLRSV